MDKLFKWLLPVLIAGDLLLVWSGLLSGETALLVVGVVELLALLVGMRQVVAAIVRYRRNRAAGLDVDGALEEGLAVIFPRPVARLVALEPRLWICLYRWLFRRRPLAAGEFSYSKRSIAGALLVFLLFSAPAEILIFELLIPWPLVRWILLIAAVYGVIWFLGYFASLKVLPYRAESDALRVYYGVTADGRIPYSLVEAIAVERRKSEKSEGLQPGPGEGAVAIACGSRTDVTLRLREPVVVQGLLKAATPASTIYLAADEPERLAAELRLRTGAFTGAVAKPTPAPGAALART